MCVLISSSSIRQNDTTSPATRSTPKPSSARACRLLVLARTRWAPRPDDPPGYKPGALLAPVTDQPPADSSPEPSTKQQACSRTTTPTRRNSPPEAATAAALAALEIADTRALVRDQVLDGAALPHLILRTGWAPTSAPPATAESMPGDRRHRRLPTRHPPSRLHTMNGRCLSGRSPS